VQPADFAMQASRAGSIVHRLELLPDGLIVGESVSPFATERQKVGEPFAHGSNLVVADAGIDAQCASVTIFANTDRNPDVDGDTGARAGNVYRLRSVSWIPV